MNKAEIEKSLKRFLKRKVGYSFAILVAFLISGEISLGVEVNNQLNAQKLAENAEKIDSKKGKVERTEGKSWQFFFSTFFDKRKAKKYDSNGFIGRNENENTRPDIKLPDEAVTPDRIDIASPTDPNVSITEPEFEFKDPANVEISGIHGGVDINLDGDDVNVIEIDENNLDLSNNGVNVPELPKNLKMEIDLTDAGDKADITINVPTVAVSYDPHTFTAPSEMEIEEIEAPETFSLDPVQIKGEGIEQDQDKEILRAGPNEWLPLDKSHETPIVIKNYESYEAGTGDKAFLVNFSQNDIYYAKEQPSGGYNHDYDGTLKLEGNNISGGDLRDYYYNKTGVWEDGVEKLDTPTGIFISDFISSDTTVSGEYNVKYEIDGKPVTGTSYLRTFFSLNPHGLYNVDAGSSHTESWHQIKFADFQGNLNLSTVQTEKGMNGNLIGLTHQIWDKYTYSVKDEVPWEYMTNFSVLLNSGTINLGVSDEGINGKEYSENMIGIMIDVDQSNKTDKFTDESETVKDTKNNKTINAGNGINIYGSKSVGISFEEYINQEQYTENTKLTDINAVHYRKKGHFILRDDAYIGNINIKGINNYAFKMGNIFDELPDYSAGKYDGPSESKKSYEEMYKYEFATYFDRVKVIGAVAGNTIEIKNDYDNSENKKIENYTSEIKLSGNNNAGMVIGKSLSSNADGYAGQVDGGFNLTDEYKTWGFAGSQNNWDEYYNNPDAYWNGDISKVEEWFKLGAVNPIANFENIKIEVGGENNIGFVRDKDYSDNNKNDMTIDDKNITDIHFAEGAENSVLLRSEQYGITLGRDFNIEFKKSDNTKADADTGNDTEEKKYKNVVMQATAQTWLKKYDYAKSDTLNSGIIKETINGKDIYCQKVNSVGTVTNNNTISGTDLKNVVAMMASGYAEGLNDGMYDGIGLGNTNKDATQQARVINNGKIEITGSENIGMAVLDDNLGILEGAVNKRVSVSTTGGNKNTAVYNTGTFNIGNADIISSGENSVGIYNTTMEYDKKTEKLDDKGDIVSDILEENAVSIGKVNIKVGTNVAASDGAIGIYSSGGTITADNGLKLTSTTEVNKESSGAGIYAVDNAVINLVGTDTDGKSNLSINVKNGVMGIGAIGTTTTDSSGTSTTISPKITITNGDISYSGKGYALYAENGGKITLDSDTKLTFDGDAYGYNIDADDTAKVELNGAEIIVNSNDVTIASVIDKNNSKNYNSSTIADNIGVDTDNIIANEYKGYKIAAIDGGSITVNGDGNDITSTNSQEDKDANMYFLQKYKFQRVKLTVEHDQTIDMVIDNDTANTYFGGEVTGLGMSASDITGDALKLEDTSITLKQGANIIAEGK